MPSKLRKTSEGKEDDKVESDGKDLQVKGEEEEEKMDNSLLKAKRTRKKKHKERVKIREEVVLLKERLAEAGVYDPAEEEHGSSEDLLDQVPPQGGRREDGDGNQSATDM
nr:la-related protein 7-like [Salvelinus alpinus]